MTQVAALKQSDQLFDVSQKISTPQKANLALGAIALVENGSIGLHRATAPGKEEHLTRDDVSLKVLEHIELGERFLNINVAPDKSELKKIDPDLQSDVGIKIITTDTFFANPLGGKDAAKNE